MIPRTIRMIETLSKGTGISAPLPKGLSRGKNKRYFGECNCCHSRCGVCCYGGMAPPEK
jgi:hypothetical protein